MISPVRRCVTTVGIRLCRCAVASGPDMPCYSPLKGFRGPSGEVVASRRYSPTQVAVTAPCGGCIGCRMDRARDWGVRIAHEVSLHDASAFITLTFSDENLPVEYSVDLRVLQLFIKRLRKAIAPVRIRFYACGEYGEERGRPHYHAIIFGYDFPDRVLWRRTERGYYTYRSPLLEKLWPFGNSEVGTVTQQSGAYVARYCLKKINGAPAADHYRRLHPLTGEIVDVRPEFATMSTKPGIGHGWFERWECDAFPSNFVVVDGERMPVPKYYRARLKERYKYPASRPEVEEVLKVGERWIDDKAKVGRSRKQFLRDHPEDLTDSRLAVREESQLLRQARIGRGL